MKQRGRQSKARRRRCYCRQSDAPASQTPRNFLASGCEHRGFGLQPLGDNLFQETEASGAANVGVPGDPGFATVQQGYLEDSNVDPVKEITELISAQRAYEMNSKVIQAADEMAAVVSKNIR